MRNQGLIVTAFTLFFCATLFAQINPLDRVQWSRGVFLNFEEFDEEDTDTLDVQQFDCENTPIFEVVDNPDPVDVPNDFPFNSANVGKITTTACTWEGIHINNEFIIDFSQRPLIWVDVYPAKADRRVALKIEDFNDNTINKQVEALTTVANQWERLVFDFSGTESGKYGRIVLLLDFEGTDVGDVWYFDNIRQAQPPVTYDDGLIEDFEVDYKMFWGDWGNCEFTIVENPDPGGINTSSKVGSFFTTTEQWEGACNAERLVPLDFSNGGGISVKVYGPAGRILGVKLENTAVKTDSPIELQITTTLEYEWEEVYADFTDRVLALNESYHTGFYDRIAIFPDFFSTAEGEDWYIDDIKWDGIPTGVKSSSPIHYQISAHNYPNPFNPGTTISYSIPNDSNVELAVFDVLGKKIKTLINEPKMAGTYSLYFDGSQLSSGTYFYKLTIDAQSITGKMLLIK